MGNDLYNEGERSGLCVVLTTGYLLPQERAGAACFFLTKGQGQEQQSRAGRCWSPSRMSPGPSEGPQHLLLIDSNLDNAPLAPELSKGIHSDS